ncbi:MAG TPA: glycosyltransferase [Roseimicrobium sp.]|nr:glycosyltransferase [Roseimicrobium sp.]
MSENTDSCLEIAIPTYNGSETIGAAIRSLFDSPVTRGLRITVYDNASTDNNAGVVASLQAEYPNLRLIRGTENIGFDGNIRRCIEGATADYVWFFSDDDLCPPSGVDRVYNALVAQQPKVLYLNHHVMSDPLNPFAGKPLNQLGDRVYTDAKAYLAVCGLGFISTLVLKRTAVLPYVDRIKLGPGHAHLDVAVRMVLDGEGPYMSLGDLSISARPVLRYDGLRSAFVNVGLFYEGLEREGYISREELTAKVRGIVGRAFISTVLRQLAKDRTGVRTMLAEFAEVGRLAGWRWRLARCVSVLPAWVPRSLMALNAVWKKWRGAGK